MILENDFNRILQSFDTVFKDKMKEDKLLKDCSYSILGSPLQTCDTIVLGDNWGGYIGKSQDHMPLVNDVLAYHNSSPTYRGCYNLISEIFDNDLNKIIAFFNGIVYTNGCFIRTPNEKGVDNKNIIKIGYELTEKYLEDIINITCAKNIVCFGNGESPSITERIAKFTDKGEFYWKEPSVEKYTYTIPKKYSFYNFQGKISGRDVNVFGFPHASRQNIWGKYLTENNNVYRKLRETLTK